MMNSKLQEIKRAVINAIKPEKIYLFGSRANGKSREDSDYDILVVKKTRNDKYKLLVKIYKSFKVRDYSLDVLIFTPKEIKSWQNTSSSFIHHVLKTGTLIYER